MIPRVAILGTGKMGAAFAARLADQEPVLWNRTRERAEALGIGRVAASPAEAVGSADLAISILTGPEAVRSAYLGPEGALAAARGRLLVEMSTAGAGLVRELEPAVLAAGARLVDAPILGSPEVVRDGGAALLLGGAAADVERARPVLERLGEVRHIGPLGSGARLKLVANSMLGALTAASAELQVAGEAAGLPRDEVFWALSRLAPGLGVRRAGYLERRHLPAQFTLRDLGKDLGLAGEIFQGLAATPMTDLARRLVGAVEEGRQGEDISTLIGLYLASPSAPGEGGEAPPSKPA